MCRWCRGADGIEGRSLVRGSGWGTGVWSVEDWIWFEGYEQPWPEEPEPPDAAEQPNDGEAVGDPEARPSLDLRSRLFWMLADLLFERAAPAAVREAWRTCHRYNLRAEAGAALGPCDDLQALRWAFGLLPTPAPGWNPDRADELNAEAEPKRASLRVQRELLLAYQMCAAVLIAMHAAGKLKGDGIDGLVERLFDVVADAMDERGGGGGEPDHYFMFWVFGVPTPGTDQDPTKD